MTTKRDSRTELAWSLGDGIVPDFDLPGRRRVVGDLTRILDDVEASGGDVRARFRAEGARRVVHAASTDATVDDVRLLAHKLVGYADGLSRGDWSPIPVHERGRVHAAIASGHVRLAATRPDVPVPAPAQPDAPVPVAFAHAWRKRGAPTFALSHGTTAVVPLDACDAPVVATLTAPDGHDLLVRRRGDLHLRPVLAPGSWSPVDLPTFERAAASGEAWADNPFLRDMARPMATLSLADHAEPQVEGRGDAALRSASGLAAVAAAGPLHVIDGIVHVGTEEPSYRLVRVLAHGAKQRSATQSSGMTVAWICGDLHPFRCMDTLATHRDLTTLVRTPAHSAGRGTLAHLDKGSATHLRDVYVALLNARDVPARHADHHVLAASRVPPLAGVGLLGIREALATLEAREWDARHWRTDRLLRALRPVARADAIEGYLLDDAEAGVRALMGTPETGPALMSPAEAHVCALALVGIDDARRELDAEPEVEDVAAFAP